MIIPTTEEQLIAAADRLGIVVGSVADDWLRATLRAVAFAMEAPLVPLVGPWLYAAPVSRDPEMRFPQVTLLLDPPMRLIEGVDPVNDGSQITRLDLAPYDGRVLCR